MHTNPRQFRVVTRRSGGGLAALALLLPACSEEPPAGRQAAETKAAPAPAASANPRQLFAWSLPASLAPAYERVVLVTIDTLRADHLPSYGYPRDTAPFFAELAGKGVLFERAFAAISHTAPSHASILTGLPPSLHGVRENGERLPEDLLSLQRLFRAAGYQSAALVSVGFLQGVAPGFDHLQALPRRAPELIDDAIRWLSGGRSATRFFLWVHLYEPHRWKKPSQVPEPALRSVRSQPVWDEAQFYDHIARLHGLPDPPEDEEFEISWQGAMTSGVQQAPQSRAELLEFIDSYDALIRDADGQIQRLYSALEQLELPGATLWILTSDHGEGLGSHGYAGHGARLYNEQLHVPLLVHATDGSLAPRRVPALVQHVDLLPTLAELLGVTLTSAQPEVAGRSLVPLLRGAAAETSVRFAFAEKKRADEESDVGELFALQDLQNKLIQRPDGQEEFFRLGDDPKELESLAAEEPARAELRRALEERLRAFSRLAPRPGAAGQDGPAPEWLEELKELGYVR
jgi:arylsulfatase A-like enzyme